MKLYTYQSSDKTNRIGIGFSEKPGYLWPAESFGLSFSDMNDLITSLTLPELLRTVSIENASDTEAINLNRIRLMAPIPHPSQDILCLGINYAAHAEESARFHKDAFIVNQEKAVYFSKRVHTASGYGDPIPLHENLTDSVDYEAELAVVLGKDAKNVTAADASDYIFGYTVINDVSARDLQTDHKQWYFGKSLDGFTPMGPCIVTADEIAFPPVLDICSRVNGEVRQNSSTGLLIHSIDAIIAELSAGMTLKAGTIIATGTPAGAGMGFTPPRFLKKGDVVECKVENIGILRNVAE